MEVPLEPNNKTLEGIKDDLEDIKYFLIPGPACKRVLLFVFGGSA